jgi:hypothetical protein
MANSTPVEITTAPAAEICARFKLDDDAYALLRDQMGAREFVEALLVKTLYITAIDFLAHAMPARQAVWWGCLCLQHAMGERLTTLDKSAAAAAVGWVLQSTEENRAAAKAPAEKAGYSSAAGSLARAVNWTGGSLGPPDMPPVPPGPFMPATAVATAIKFAAVKVEPAKIVGTQRLFVDLGIEVAEGRHLRKERSYLWENPQLE